MKLNLIKNLNIHKASLLIAAISILFLLVKTVIPATKISPYTSLSFSVLLDEQSKNVLTDARTTEFVAGEKIKGSFKAGEDNLGIVLVRFVNTNKNNKPPSDSVVFRIKEINSGKWHYEHTYKIDQFQPHQYFTFGFPKISASKNKIFTFEIESITGKTDDATALSPKMPQVAFAYQFSKNELIADKTLLLRFMVKKLWYAVLHINLALPLIVYIVSFITLWLLKKASILGTDRFYKIAKKIFMQAIYLLWFLLLLIVNFSGRLFSIGQKLYKLLNRIQQYFLLLNKKSFPIFHILIIFFVAFTLRLAFYLNPANVDDFIFSQIGGFGDYDMLIRHTLRFMEQKTLNTYFWSFLDDYFIQVRLFELFFNTFGFAKALEYLEYLSILLGSITCIFPFILLTRLKKFSIGGFIAGIFLAVNPTLVWISSSRILDTITVFFLSLFIFVFILSLEKKNFILLLLLGFIGLISGLNRGVMALATLPALLLFAGYYIFPNKKNRQTVLYAFTPFLVFIFFYTLWAVYYQITFSVPWIYSPQMLSHLYSYTAPVSSTDNSSIFYFLFSHLILYILAMIQFISLTALSKFILAALIAVSLLYMKKPFRQKLIIAVIPLVATWAILFLLQKLLLILPIDLQKFPWRYFTTKEILLSEYVYLGLFIELVVVWFIILKKEFLKYAIIILPYLLLLGFSYLKTFSERHFSQLIFVFFILIGILIDRTFPRFSLKKNAFLTLTIMVFVAVAFSSFINKSYEGGRDIFVYKTHAQKEIDYLKFVDSSLPANAIILSGAKNGENLLWVLKFAKRDVIYNIYNPHLVIIPHGNKLPRMPISVKYPVFDQYDFSDNRSNVTIENMFSNDEEFSRNNFYILDYNAEEENVIFYRYPNRFTLKEVARRNERKIYKVTKI